MSTLQLIDSYLKDVAAKLGGKFDTELTIPSKAEMPTGYEYRSISWINEGLNFSFEIFPNLTGNKNQLNEWNFDYCVYFDESGRRYSHRSSVIKNGPKKAITENIQDLLDFGFKMMRDHDATNKGSFETITDIKI